MSNKPQLRVLDPGPFATIQDEGRKGFQRFGVSESGALDRISLRLANLLVGNDPTEAAIEFTLAGGVYECLAERCRVAIAGAEVSPRLIGEARAVYESFEIRRGERLEIGLCHKGCRGYLAIEGGFDLPLVLGSCSTHVRSGLGGFEGRALRCGDQLGLRLPASGRRPELVLQAPFRPSLKKAGLEQDCLRVVFGPQAAAFGKAARELLLDESYRISPRSDRMACLLEGPAIPAQGDFNIVSDGIANGSIQVTGDGQPIILLADRQTTGGFPKIATVIEADLPLLAQRAPGAEVRFRAIDVAEAEAAYRAQVAWQADATRKGLRRCEYSFSSERLLSVNLISGVVPARSDGVKE